MQQEKQQANPRVPAPATTWTVSDVLSSHHTSQDTQPESIASACHSVFGRVQAWGGRYFKCQSLYFHEGRDFCFVHKCFHIVGTKQRPDWAWVNKHLKYVIRWTWTWANAGRWWGTGRPGVLLSTGSWRVRHDLAIDQQQQVRQARLRGKSNPQISAT